MGLSNAQRQQRWRAKRLDVVERALRRAAERCQELPEAERLALADKLSAVAADHLRRSNELSQLAWRLRFLVPPACIVIALLTTLAVLVPSNAQDVRFHDAQGRVTGSARTDANGVTTFHDRVGRVTGTARTDRNGVTTFRDAAGRTTGSIRK
jgi:hypothetical protein